MKWDEMSDQEIKSHLFSFPPAREPGQLHPLVLAYMGDAIYEVFVRQYVVAQTNHKPN